MNNYNLFTKNYKSLLLVAYLCFPALYSCNKNDKQKVVPTANINYVIFGSNDNSSYMVGAESMTKGTASIIGNGADVTEYEGIRAPNLIQKDGFFYWIDKEGLKFVKMKFENNKLSTVAAIPFPNAGGAASSYQWLNNHTLFIDMFDQFVTVDTETMNFIESGSFPIPLQEGVYYYRAQSSYISGGKLYLPFAYFNTAYQTDDTARLAVVDYPAMTNLTITKDARLPDPGAANCTQQALFEEGGYIYVSCTNVESSSPSTTKAGVMRIKIGEKAFDPNYLFITNDGLTDAQISLQYLGNGKAIIKSGPDDFESPGDFYVVDVIAKTKTKLNLPGSAIDFRGNVLVDDGKAHILCDTDYHVYTYNSADGSITKGLKVEGINYIEGLYKIK